MESQGKKLVKWVSLDSIAEQILADKRDYYGNQCIGWDLILCAKGKQSDSYTLMQFDSASKQQVINNVTKF